jgi:hypothetical protein
MGFRIIKVICCKECPYMRHDDGGGFIEPFDKCEEFNIILQDENINFNLNKIHPKCRLRKGD